MKPSSVRLASVLLAGLLYAEEALAQCPPGPPPPPPPPSGKPPGPPPGPTGAPPGATGPAGGTYSGPGDTTPSTPGPAGPSNPGGSSSTGGIGGPANPGGGPAVSPRGPAVGMPGAAGPTAASSPAASLDSFSGPNAWELWWRFNQHAFLDLREAIWTGPQVTGDDEFHLGEGTTSQFVGELRPSRAQLTEQVAPALRRVLESEDNPGVLAAALMGLAQLGELPESAQSERSRELIRGYVAHSNRHVAETAVLALGVQGAPASIFDLAGLLRESESGSELCGADRVPARLRAYAAYSLGLVAEKCPENPDLQRFCAHALVQALEHDGSASADLGVACVTGLGLTRLPEVAGAATTELPTSSRQALVAWLTERMERGKLRDLERAHLPRAMARQVDPLEMAGEHGWLRSDVARALLRQLETSRTDRRLAAGCVLALGSIGNAGDSALDALIRRKLRAQLRDGDRTQRGFSLVALGQIGGRPGPPGEGALAGLSEIEEHLLTTLARGKSDVRPWAALALGVQGYALRARGMRVTEDVTAALRTQLDECGSPAEVGAYALALGLRGDIRSGPKLVAKLERFHEDAPLGYIAQGLGLMDERQAVEPLLELLAGATFRPELARPVVMGLALLDHEALVPEILAELEADHGSYVQGLMAWTLTYVGDSRALAPVVASLENADQPAHNRAIAAYAAGAIGDQGLLPWNAPVALDVNYSAATETLYAEDGQGVLDVR